MVYLPERAETTVEHALGRHAVVGHGVDEVLDLRAVVVEELLAIVVGEVEESAQDDVVAICYRVVELSVCRGAWVVVGHVATGVDRPVHVQFHQEGLRHPLVWLAVGGCVACRGQVGQALFQLFLYELGHVLARLSLNGLVVVEDLVQYGHVAIAVHQYEVVEGSHGAEVGYVTPRGGVVLFRQLVYELVAPRDASGHVAPPVEGLVARVEGVQGGVDVLSPVVVVAIETQARGLVGRERLVSVVVVAELLAEGVVGIGHLPLQGYLRLCGVLREFRLDVNVEVGARRRSHGDNGRRHQVFHFCHYSLNIKS